MKIAILSPFYPYRGGIAQFSGRLYTELQKENEVKAFTFTTLYPEFLFPGKTQYVTEDDTATVIDSERVLNSINPFSYIKTAKRINKYEPDVLIVAYWMPFMSPAYSIICNLINKKTKIIALVHNVISHEPSFFEAPLAKLFFNRCDGFIALSEPVKKDLQRLKPNSKVLVKEHPIYDHYGDRIDKAMACKDLGIKDYKKNLLFFGLIRDYKGLDMLIEAMADLDDSYQLIIAGECYGDFSKYQRLIGQSPLRDNIVAMEQYIPDSLVPTLFSASDVLVLPYRSATQSGVIALAYQMELPMIGTNVGALGETIRESQTGLVTEKVSKEAISKAILDFFNTSDIDIYKENLLKEKKRLSWANFAQSIEDFVKGL